MIDPRKKLQGKTVLVTGGAGFIGSHLSERLLSYGARVVCFDNLSTGNLENLLDARKNPRFSFMRGDVNRLADIKKAFNQHKIDFIFHYAALVGVQRTIDDPLKVLADIDGIRNMLALASKHKVKKIVYASSSEIYGNQEKMPLHEEYSYYDAKIPYATVKILGENYLRTYWETSGLPITILRFFNAYGPRQESSRYGFVTGVFISQVLQNKAPTIFHDGMQTRDFMYIDDNIEAAIQALLNHKADGQAINLGTGKETTILELAQKIVRLAGKEKTLKPSLLHKRNTVEIKRRVANTEKMEKLLGFHSKYSLEEGLRLTYEWYLHHPYKVKKGKKLSYREYRKQVWASRHNGKHKKAK